MRVAGAPRRLALDTVTYLAPKWRRVMWRCGYRTVMRYLNPTRYWRATPDLDDWIQTLSAQELDELTAAGWHVGVVQRGIGRAHQGGEAVGDSWGTAAAHNAAGVGLPAGCHIYCDCEWAGADMSRSWPGPPPEPVQRAYIEAWARAVIRGGYRAGLYVSPDLRLDSAALYALRGISSYWYCASATQAVDVRRAHLTQSLEYAAHLDGTIEPWDTQAHQGLQTRGQVLRFDADMVSASRVRGVAEWPLVAAS